MHSFSLLEALLQQLVQIGSVLSNIEQLPVHISFERTIVNFLYQLNNFIAVF